VAMVPKPINVDSLMDVVRKFCVVVRQSQQPTDGR